MGGWLGVASAEVDYVMTRHEGIIRVLTLLALAHPIGRERRGGVIVDGGHGQRTIDIILGPNWPEFCMLQVTVIGQFKTS